MKTRFVALLALLLLGGVASTSHAALINVSQGGTSLGVINSYADATGNTSAQNYNFFSSTNHLNTGPSLSNAEGHIYWFNGNGTETPHQCATSATVRVHVREPQPHIHQDGHITNRVLLRQQCTPAHIQEVDIKIEPTDMDISHDDESVELDRD